VAVAVFGGSPTGGLRPQLLLRQRVECRCRFLPRRGRRGSGGLANDDVVTVVELDQVAVADHRLAERNLVGVGGEEPDGGAGLGGHSAALRLHHFTSRM
jgi:hypothetical protein